MLKDTLRGSFVETFRKFEDRALRETHEMSIAEVFKPKENPLRRNKHQKTHL